MRKRKNEKPKFLYWCRACHRQMKLEGSERVKCPNPDCGRNELYRKRNITKKQERAIRLASHEFGEVLSRKKAAKLMEIGESSFNRLLADAKKACPQLFPLLTEREAIAYILATDCGMQNPEIMKKLGTSTSNAVGKLIQACKRKNMPFGFDLRKKGYEPINKLTKNSADAALERLQKREKENEAAEKRAKKLAEKREEAEVAKKSSAKINAILKKIGDDFDAKWDEFINPKINPKDYDPADLNIEELNKKVDISLADDISLSDSDSNDSDSEDTQD